VEIFRQEEHGDHDAAEHVADDDLQESEVAGEGEAGGSDDGQCRSFGGDDRERDRPPRNGTVGKEVAAERFVACRAAFGEAQSEECDGDEVKADDAEIERMQPHRHCLSIGHFVTRIGRRDGAPDGRRQKSVPIGGTALQGCERCRAMESILGPSALRAVLDASRVRAQEFTFCRAWRFARGVGGVRVGLIAERIVAGWRLVVLVKRLSAVGCQLSASLVAE
jgi:hypothetical protein